MPGEDETVRAVFDKYLPRMKRPKKLSAVLPELLSDDSPYIGVFVPGGHGALVGLPESDDVKTAMSSGSACWTSPARRL